MSNLHVAVMQPLQKVIKSGDIGSLRSFLSANDLDLRDYPRDLKILINESFRDRDWDMGSYLFSMSGDANMIDSQSIQHIIQANHLNLIKSLVDQYGLKTGIIPSIAQKNDEIFDLYLNNVDYDIGDLNYYLNDAVNAQYEYGINRLLKVGAQITQTTKWVASKYHSKNDFIRERIFEANARTLIKVGQLQPDLFENEPQFEEYIAQDYLHQEIEKKYGLRVRDILENFQKDLNDLLNSNGEDTAFMEMSYIDLDSRIQDSIEYELENAEEWITDAEGQAVQYYQDTAFTDIEVAYENSLPIIKDNILDQLNTIILAAYANNEEFRNYMSEIYTGPAMPYNDKIINNSLTNNDIENLVSDDDVANLIKKAYDSAEDLIEDLEKFIRIADVFDTMWDYFGDNRYEFGLDYTDDYDIYQELNSEYGEDNIEFKLSQLYEGLGSDRINQFARYYYYDHIAEHVRDSEWEYLRERFNELERDIGVDDLEDFTIDLLVEENPTIGGLVAWYLEWHSNEQDIPLDSELEGFLEDANETLITLAIELAVDADRDLYTRLLNDEGLFRPLYSKSNPDENVNIAHFLSENADHYLQIRGAYQIGREVSMASYQEARAAYDAQEEQLTSKLSEMENWKTIEPTPELSPEWIAQRINDLQAEIDHNRAFLDQKKQAMDEAQAKLQADTDKIPPALDMSQSKFVSEIFNGLFDNYIRTNDDNNEFIPKFAHQMNTHVNKGQKKLWVNNTAIPSFEEYVTRQPGVTDASFAIKEIYKNISNNPDGPEKQSTANGIGYVRKWITGRVFDNASSVHNAYQPFLDEGIAGQPLLGRFMVDQLINDSQNNIDIILRERKNLIMQKKLIPGNKAPENAWDPESHKIEDNYVVPDKKRDILAHFGHYSHEVYIDAGEEYKKSLAAEMFKQNLGKDLIIKFLNKINLPEKQTIKPSKIDIGDFTFNIAIKTDPINAVGGNITGCCFKVGGMAESSLIDAFNNPYSTFLNIYMKGTNVLVAQSWLRSSEANDEGKISYYLDNIETTHSYRHNQNLKDAVISFSKRLKEERDLSGIFIGTGYSKLDFGKALPGIKNRKLPGTTPGTYSDLSDGMWQVAKNWYGRMKQATKDRPWWMKKTTEGIYAVNAPIDAEPGRVRCLIKERGSIDPEHKKQSNWYSNIKTAEDPNTEQEKDQIMYQLKDLLFITGKKKAEDLGLDWRYDSPYANTYRATQDAILLTDYYYNQIISGEIALSDIANQRVEHFFSLNKSSSEEDLRAIPEELWTERILYQYIGEGYKITLDGLLKLPPNHLYKFVSEISNSFYTHLETNIDAAIEILNRLVMHGFVPEAKKIINDYLSTSKSFVNSKVTNLGRLFINALYSKFGVSIFDDIDILINIFSRLSPPGNGDEKVKNDDAEEFVQMFRPLFDEELVNALIKSDRYKENLWAVLPEEYYTRENIAAMMESKHISPVDAIMKADRSWFGDPQIITKLFQMGARNFESIPPEYQTADNFLRILTMYEGMDIRRAHNLFEYIPSGPEKDAAHTYLQDFIDKRMEKVMDVLPHLEPSEDPYHIDEFSNVFANISPEFIRKEWVGPIIQRGKLNMVPERLKNDPDIAHLMEKKYLDISKTYLTLTVNLFTTLPDQVRRKPEIIKTAIMSFAESNLSDQDHDAFRNFIENNEKDMVRYVNTATSTMPLHDALTFLTNNQTWNQEGVVNFLNKHIGSMEKHVIDKTLRSRKKMQGHAPHDVQITKGDFIYVKFLDEFEQFMVENRDSLFELHPETTERFDSFNNRHQASIIGDAFRNLNPNNQYTILAEYLKDVGMYEEGIREIEVNRKKYPLKRILKDYLSNAGYWVITYTDDPRGITKFSLDFALDQTQLRGYPKEKQEMAKWLAHFGYNFDEDEDGGDYNHRSFYEDEDITIVEALEKIQPSEEAHIPPDKRNIGNFVFEILQKTDPIGIVLGNITSCCQIIDGLGKDTVYDGYNNPNSGFLAIYDNKGRIVAQSWLRLGQQTGTLFLDNVEAVGSYDANYEGVSRKKTEALSKAIMQWANEMKQGRGYAQVLVGGNADVVLKNVKEPISERINFDAEFDDGDDIYTDIEEYNSGNYRIAQNWYKGALRSKWKEIAKDTPSQMEKSERGERWFSLTDKEKMREYKPFDMNDKGHVFDSAIGDYVDWSDVGEVVSQRQSGWYSFWKNVNLTESGNSDDKLCRDRVCESGN